MLGRYLEDLVDPESIRNEDVLVSREDGIFMISTNAGSLSIKPNGKNWDVGFLTIDSKDTETVFNGENKMIKDWYAGFLNTRIEDDKYIQLPCFDKTLNFAEAYELSAYILSKILPKAHSQNMMIN
jgi:hypothetical protein